MQPTSDDPRHATVPALLSGIVTDARDLLGGHVQALRSDVSDELRDLKAVLAAMALALAAAIVGASLTLLAVASTLIALGLESWAAMWSVAIIAVLLTMWLLQRARVRARALRPS